MGLNKVQKLWYNGEEQVIQKYPENMLQIFFTYTGNVETCTGKAERGIIERVNGISTIIQG